MQAQPANGATTASADRQRRRPGCRRHHDVRANQSLDRHSQAGEGGFAGDEDDHRRRELRRRDGGRRRFVCSAIDHVFSGESEETFVDFLMRLDGGGEIPRVIAGAPCLTLDRLPPPDFADYYVQIHAFLPPHEAAKLQDVWLPYETSRGCSWGQKHQCTFCGANGATLAFRGKQPDRVIQDLRQIRSASPSNRIMMADNIMPNEYFSALLPRLRDELPGLHIFYELKANLSLRKVPQPRRSGRRDHSAGDQISLDRIVEAHEEGRVGGPEHRPSPLRANRRHRREVVSALRFPRRQGSLVRANRSPAAAVASPGAASRGFSDHARSLHARPSIGPAKHPDCAT